MNKGVLSVVYPGVEPYLPDFLSSLENQTENNFVLYLINDGINGVEYFLDAVDLNVKIKNKTGTPAALRKIGLKWLLGEDIDVVVFADADDYFSRNRIEVSIEKLGYCDIVVNELILVGYNYSTPVPILRNYFAEGQFIFPQSIKDANCMGL